MTDPHTIAAGLSEYEHAAMLSVDDDGYISAANAPTLHALRAKGLVATTAPRLLLAGLAVRAIIQEQSL